MKLIYAFCFCFLLNNCAITTQYPSKINGVSYVASRDSITEIHIKPLLNIHANYASIMPFGFIRDLSHPIIQYNSKRQWFGETKAGVKHYIHALKTNGIHIMIKPQIWVWKGEFTGDITMKTEADWKAFENSYTQFILDYAEVAQEIGADIFCIGTELEHFIEARPNYWKELIKKIRQVYKGKLTYAANWNEYNQTPFWNKLDYIGIDAYFPVSDLKTPTVEACKLGLGRWKTEMKHTCDSLKKPVLFTEFGYRSVDFSGKKPWLTDRQMGTVNLQAQTNATQAFFETFWNEDWIAGGFIWKWHHNHKTAGGNNNTRFTPQNKPAEQVIKDFYSKK
ncbi:glycoside hydrolase family 113 [Yeosuana aromativorans]|uniref:glycoside hydrolase family 113 n=1 Tax=Yeosuana aromativorans TaxID=288019 RepID=UPI00166AD31B|nr:glycoside hydrolase TIM-barrel-like domain-containing protein [Yeosuana aromativorans]